jgi:hypothetical protein
VGPFSWSASDLSIPATWNTQNTPVTLRITWNFPSDARCFRTSEERYTFYILDAGRQLFRKSIACSEYEVSKQGSATLTESPYSFSGAQTGLSATSAYTYNLMDGRGNRVQYTTAPAVLRLPQPLAPAGLGVTSCCANKTTTYVFVTWAGQVPFVGTAVRYRARISAANSKTSFSGWSTITGAWSKRLTRKKTYVIQVQSVTDYGSSSITSKTFTTR